MPKPSNDNPMLEDVMALGGNLLSNIFGARHELRAQAKARFGGLSQQLGLVSREEFDAAFAMLAKARDRQEELAARLATIEAKLNLSSAKTPVKTKKSNLPSVKNSDRRPKRG